MSPEEATHSSLWERPYNMRDSINNIFSVKSVTTNVPFLVFLATKESRAPTARTIPAWGAAQAGIARAFGP
jgi:hypothetical protein